MRHILIVAIFHSGEYHGTTLECHSQYSIGILALGWNYSIITLNRLYTCIGAANVPWKRFGLHCKDINITIELFCFCFVLVSKLLRNCFGTTLVVQLNSNRLGILLVLHHHFGAGVSAKFMQHIRNNSELTRHCSDIFIIRSGSIPRVANTLCMRAP